MEPPRVGQPRSCRRSAFSPGSTLCRHRNSWKRLGCTPGPRLLSKAPGVWQQDQGTPAPQKPGFPFLSLPGLPSLLLPSNSSTLASGISAFLKPAPATSTAPAARTPPEVAGVWRPAGAGGSASELIHWVGVGLRSAGCWLGVQCRALGVSLEGCPPHGSLLPARASDLKQWQQESERAPTSEEMYLGHCTKPRLHRPTLGRDCTKVWTPGTGTEAISEAGHHNPQHTPRICSSPGRYGSKG